MTKSDIEKDIRSVVADVMGIESLPDDPDLDLIVALKIDSLDALEMAMRVQEHFNVVISEGEFVKFRTINQMVGEIDRVLDEAKSATISK
jgi:acyl carrier protein